MYECWDLNSSPRQVCTANSCNHCAFSLLLSSLLAKAFAGPGPVLSAEYMCPLGGFCTVRAVRARCALMWMWLHLALAGLKTFVFVCLCPLCIQGMACSFDLSPIVLHTLSPGACAGTGRGGSGLDKGASKPAAPRPCRNYCWSCSARPGWAALVLSVARSLKASPCYILQNWYHKHSWL